MPDNTISADQVYTDRELALSLVLPPNWQATKQSGGGLLVAPEPVGPAQLVITGQPVPPGAGSLWRYLAEEIIAASSDPAVTPLFKGELQEHNFGAANYLMQNTTYPAGEGQELRQLILVTSASERLYILVFQVEAAVSEAVLPQFIQILNSIDFTAEPVPLLVAPPTAPQVPAGRWRRPRSL